MKILSVAIAVTGVVLLGGSAAARDESPAYDNRQQQKQAREDEAARAAAAKKAAAKAKDLAARLAGSEDVRSAARGLADASTRKASSRVLYRAADKVRAVSLAGDATFWKCVKNGLEADLATARAEIESVEAQLASLRAARLPSPAQVKKALEVAKDMGKKAWDALEKFVIAKDVYETARQWFGSDSLDDALEKMNRDFKLDMKEYRDPPTKERIEFIGSIA